LPAGPHDTWLPTGHRLGRPKKSFPIHNWTLARNVSRLPDQPWRPHRRGRKVILRGVTAGGRPGGLGFHYGLAARTGPPTFCVVRPLISKRQGREGVERIFQENHSHEFGRMGRAALHSAIFSPWTKTKRAGRDPRGRPRPGRALSWRSTTHARQTSCGSRPAVIRTASSLRMSLD